MEEANKLLPSENDRKTLDHGRGRKKRLQVNDDMDVGVGRSSKQKVAQSQPDSEEEAAACEMLDRLMLNNEPSHASMQQELLSFMELEKPRGRHAGARHTVDLHALLIRCAEAVATNDLQGAVDLLQRIRHHSSPTGDGTQRLAHCFTQGLEARLLGTGNQMYKSLLAKCGATTGTLRVYQMYMAACSILPVSYLLSNKITYNAIAGRKKLHIVHYGLGHGFHLPDLLRMLSSREGGPPEVRLTSIDNPLPGFHPGQLIEETGRRLSDCARQFRVPFKFHAIAAKLEAVCADDLDIDPDEVLVVVSHFCFKNLMDESVILDRPNPRDTVLNNITKMRPKVFIHDIANGSYSGAFFVPRFREALNHFAAVFDAMDTIMLQENQNRLLVEEWLAACAMNVIACEGVDRVSRPHNYKQWQVRSERAGLRQLPLNPDIVQTYKDKVKKEYRKHIVINEDQEWLLTGWKGRVISAFSTWTADDDTSGLRK
ncbi:scarecrow-like protein 9 [Miscanthus floridulus]|uniref:scarecrow-like protein 9 n=1 Tax=Miscanthus floridulus TaxID=154761 RepID=UPI00345A8D70